MRGKDHEHKHAAHEGKRHRAKGGKAKEAGGNPYVEHEAHETEDGEETERKHGGKAKHHGKHHGKEHEHKKERKHGGKIEGHHPKHRMDKPGRKRGGRVGADTSPLSSANRTSKPTGEPATQQGGMST